MTIVAACRQFSLMIIVMTGSTTLTQTNIRLTGLTLCFGLLDMLCIVAGTTILACMLAFQHKSGFIMIKCFLVEADQFKLTSVMLVVTTCTIFPVYLTRSMISFFSKNIAFNFFMTIQTFFAGYFFAYRMTLRTVTQTFEMGMCFAQVAGRYL
jgi:hypothetical protein